jgi:flagellar biosynthesis protein FlhF
MKVQRFIGINGREALGFVRMALGPEAMILSNRTVPQGIEILACSANDFNGIIESSERPVGGSPAFRSEPRITPTPPPVLAAPMYSSAKIMPDISELMGELKAMRNSLESQIAEISWAGNPEKASSKNGVLRELLNLGFSASLSRYLSQNAPGNMKFEEALQWTKNVLIRNIDTITSEDDFLDNGGVYALVGPTGVGKTTTTAKLAARYVMRHGTKNLALITTDGYRIGGHEQLRIYGKILGVMVHSVKDEVDLRIALEELKDKHMVLIDTVGMSQRDQMVTEQISMLDGTKFPVKRLLCLNTTSNIETLNEVVAAYRGSGVAGCILTKLDEAAVLSNAIDVVLRQKLRLFYVGTGQRVPEDLTIASAKTLVEQTFKKLDFVESDQYDDSELSTLMSTKTAREDLSTRGIYVA